MTEQSTPTPTDAETDGLINFVVMQTVDDLRVAGWKSPVEVAELVRAAAEEAWGAGRDEATTFTISPGWGYDPKPNPYSKPTTDTTEEPNGRNT